MAEDEPGQAPKLQEDKRLASLDERIRQAKNGEAVRTGTKRMVPRRGQSQGMRVLSDLFGIPFGSALMGWLVDRWVGTGPWVMLAMLFLGFGIAVRNIMRISREPPE